jgi:hypothetical protein
MNVYKFIRENGEWANWSIVVIEEYVAQNKNDLHSRERYWMEQLKPSLNKCVPTRTDQEYRTDHKEDIKQYRNEHKEGLNLYQKQYRNEHKEEISLRDKQYKADHKEEINLYQKQYRNEHKEELDLYNIQYNADHKEEIALKGSVKVNCPCGGKYTVGQKSAHFKTKKHQTGIIQILPNPSTEPIQEPAPDDEELLGGHSIIF